MQPKALDLFCGAGGATKGLQRAGFIVHGIDINPQPRYCGEQFTQADALEYGTYEWLRQFDFIWASPPCQCYCALKTMLNKREHPALIEPVRKKLISSRLPWVIENVFGAPLDNPLMLCGSHFSLESQGYQLRRHRYFESSLALVNGNKCFHGPKTVGVYGAKARYIAMEKRHYAQPKTTRGRPIGVVLPRSVAFEAMGIDWMNMNEISEAIPPAYSYFIGMQVMDMINK